MIRNVLAVTMLMAILPATANALPFLPAAPAVPDGAVIKAHACHRSCEWGPVLRWHRHAAHCRPLACLPRAVHPGRCFVDRYGVRHCRW